MSAGARLPQQCRQARPAWPAGSGCRPPPAMSTPAGRAASDHCRRRTDSRRAPHEHPTKPSTVSRPRSPSWRPPKVCDPPIGQHGHMAPTAGDVVAAHIRSQVDAFHERAVAGRRPRAGRGAQDAGRQPSAPQRARHLPRPAGPRRHRPGPRRAEVARRPARRRPRCRGDPAPAGRSRDGRTPTCCPPGSAGGSSAPRPTRGRRRTRTDRRGDGRPAVHVAGRIARPRWPPIRRSPAAADTTRPRTTACANPSAADGDS